MSTSGQLAAYCAAYSGRSFDWATANCCHFASGWVREETGRDPLAAVPVTRNKFGALRQIKRMGGTLVAVWTVLMGAEAISPKLAHIGDIVLFDVGMGAVGVCAGRTSVVALADGAIAHVPTLEAIAAWRVS